MPNPKKTCLFSWKVILGAYAISMDLTEEWEEKNIQKIYKHPLFDQIPKAAYYDVAVLGKNINIQNNCRFQLVSRFNI